MSMQVVLIKVSSLLHQRLVESNGELLNDMGNDERVEGYSPESDTYDELDYRDLASWAEDETHPMCHLFRGDPLLEGYEWAYGAPLYHDHQRTKELLQNFKVCDDDDWQVTSVADFLERAVKEEKGVFVGVA